MTYGEACRVRDKVKQYGNLWCIVPKGHGPSGYFARINSHGRYIDFGSMREARSWLACYLLRQRERRRWLNRPADIRTPLEKMIDNACGYTPLELR